LGFKTKLRTMLDGRQSGGTAFSRGHLYRILANPIYIGCIPHKGRSYEGEHEAIIDAETWDKVQAQLALNAGRKRGRNNSKDPSLLAGLLFTAEDVPFTPSHAVNHGRRYRYYVERLLLTADASKGKSAEHRVDGTENGQEARGWRLPAHQIERFVLKQLAAFLRDRRALLDALHFKRKSLDRICALLARASKLADACESRSFANYFELVATLVRRITVAHDHVTIEIDWNGLAERLLDQETSSESGGNDHPSIPIEVPVKFRRRGVEAKLVVLDQRQSTFEPDATLIKALARAHEWLGRILRSEASGIGEIACAESLDRTYVTRVLCLAFLSPEITKAVLKGRQPTKLTAKRLIGSALAQPLLWPDQIDHIGPESDQKRTCLAPT
jgi:site-specific DNA recombinase